MGHWVRFTRLHTGVGRINYSHIHMGSDPISDHRVWRRGKSAVRNVLVCPKHRPPNKAYGLAVLYDKAKTGFSVHSLKLFS